MTDGAVTVTTATPPTTQPATSTTPPDQEFPANTSLEHMSTAEVAAYWRDKARKHEDRVKAFGGLTPEQVSELRAKADKHDALELELGTTADKAAAKAAQDAKDAARSEYEPEVINARLEAAAARAGVSDEDLAKAVEFVDPAKFITKDGKVDTDRVKAFVATITPPAKGNQPGAQRSGPSSNGLGNRSGPIRSTAGAGGVAAGRDLWAEMHPPKKT